jgi:predicted TIM-barrel fold metal-dependent hydrolase
MDYFGISKALVRHTKQRDGSPVVGNEILLREIEGNDRLYGAFAILPLQTGELGTIDTLLKKMKEKNVRSFLAFPSEHRYSMSRTALSPLYDLMVERNIPIFIPVGESSGVSGWHMIENILSEVQELTLVVTDHNSCRHNGKGTTEDIIRQP